MSKKLPCSIEAEEGCLGSILLDGANKALLIQDKLSPEAFFLRENQLIYEAICFLLNENKPIDILTVRTYLDDRNLLEAIGGNAKLIGLTESVFSTANIENYAKIVRNKHLLRMVIKAGVEIEMMGRDEDENIEDTFANVGETIRSLSHLHTFSSIATMDDDLCAYQEYLAEREGKEVFGYSWGPNLKWLDDPTDGIQKKKTYRIGAKSNTGKSQLIYQVIANLLMQGAKVTFFTLESAREEIINYMLAYMQKVNSHKLANGTVKADIDQLYKYSKQLTIVEYTTYLHDIFSKTKKIQPDVVILDYIALVNIKGFKGEDMFAEYAKLVPMFAKEQNVAWIDLSNQPKSDTAELMRSEGQFYGHSSLKNNLDYGIHIIYNEQFFDYKQELRKGGMNDPSIHSKSVVDVCVTKNRYKQKDIEQTYIIDFNRGGEYSEATEEQKSRWF